MSARCESLYLEYCICLLTCFFYTCYRSFYIASIPSKSNMYHIRKLECKPTLSIWKQPWQKQNRTEHVNWLPEVPQFCGQQIDAWWIRTPLQTPAEQTICFSTIPLIRDTYFHLFLFPTSRHWHCCHPTSFCLRLPIVANFEVRLLMVRSRVED